MIVALAQSLERAFSDDELLALGSLAMRLLPGMDDAKVSAALGGAHNLDPRAVLTAAAVAHVSGERPP